MRTFGRIGGVICLLILVALLIPPGSSPVLYAGANTGCPGSTNAFGAQSLSGDCAITADTTWGNGTLTIAGSITVNVGVTLTLWDLAVRFSSTSDLQHSLTVNGGLVVQGGTLTSADAYHWVLTSYGVVRMDGASVSRAGHGTTAGVTFGGPGGNRITRTQFSGTRVILGSNHNDYFAYNNVSNYDDSPWNTSIFWVGSNTTVAHNTFWNLTSASQAVLWVYKTWGNITIFANTFYARANGNNAMVLEVINVQAAQTAVVPTGYTVRETWNNVTWLSVNPGNNVNAFDNEFSERVYIANNTVTAPSGQPGTVTECLEGGGMTASVLENNTCLGRMSFGIYDYIYSDAGNIFQYNRFDGPDYGGIFQTGGNTVRYNAFLNLTGVGFRICPNASCAGSSANTSNNVWYGNTYTFASTPAYLVKMSLGNAFYNTYLGHGASAWTDGTTSHSVYGDWLFWANAPIRQLVVQNSAAGSRTLQITTGGRSYSDLEPAPSVTDNASVVVDGSIDSHGSVYGGTAIWSLAAGGTTSLDVAASGPETFTFHGFEANYTYNVTLLNHATGVRTNETLAMDASGSASLAIDFGTGAQYTVTLGGNFPIPVDTTPPAQVTDLRASTVGSGYVVLQWTAPGDNGTQGQASEYDLRYSTAGPLNETTFPGGTPFPIPPPGPAGTTETHTVTGLMPATEYWFALRTADSVPNWSPISNDAAVVTLALPPTNGSEPGPAVTDASVNVSASLVAITFSQPMNESSVKASLNVTPTAEFHLVWVNETKLQVVFDTPLAPSTQYTLSIASSATNRTGSPLGSAFVFTFQTSPQPPPGSGWVVSELLSFAAIWGAGLLTWLALWPPSSNVLKGALRRGGRRVQPRAPRVQRKGMGKDERARGKSPPK